MPASAIPEDQSDPPPSPPVPPNAEDCCNSGCSPCIFDFYQEDLERYREELKAWEERQARRAGQRGADR